MDGFKVVTKDPDIWIERIASVFLIKEYSPRKYYLVNDYKYHENHDMWNYEISTCTKDDVSRVERI